MVRAGYLDSSRRGVWSLTEKGFQTDLARFDPYQMFQAVQKEFHADKKKRKRLKRLSSMKRTKPALKPPITNWNCST